MWVVDSIWPNEAVAVDGASKSLPIVKFPVRFELPTTSNLPNEPVLAISNLLNEPVDVKLPLTVPIEFILIPAGSTTLNVPNEPVEV